MSIEFDDIRVLIKCQKANAIRRGREGEREEKIKERKNEKRKREHSRETVKVETHLSVQSRVCFFLLPFMLL